MARKPAAPKEVREKAAKKERKQKAPAKEPERKSPREPKPRVIQDAIPVQKEPVEKMMKKKKGEKKAAAKKKPKQKVLKSQSKPTYERMIKKAILAEQKADEDTTMVSIPRIAAYIKNNYPVPEGYRRFMRMALKAGVANGTFVQRRASFRLSAKAQRRGRSRKRSSSRGRSSSRSKSPAKKEKKKAKKREASASPRKEASKKESPKKKKKTREGKEGKEESPKKKKKTTTTKEPVSAGAREVQARPDGRKYDHIWQYEDNGWKNYDPKASDVVEGVYQGYLANRGDTDVRAVRSGQWEYQVDFMAMKQMNIQHENHTVRNIRRIKVGE